MLTLTQNEVFAGRYRVLRSLASGGMGAVYEVEHVETSRHHALKVLLPSLVDRQEIRDRFKLEARITAAIESDAIVQVFDAGVDGDTGMPFLVMELLKGEDLSRVVAREGAQSPSVVVSYLSQVASALDKTHSAKVVHRDLKPENLFISRKEDGSKQIKVLDFGVAKLMVEGAAGASTTTGFGTPLYMAPEQFKCAGVCSSTDIYSLGMIAFTMLVGTPYWEPEVAKRGTVFAFATLAVNGTREPATERARKLGKELPAAFDPWFSRMTAVDPGERYDNPSQAIEDLARVFSVRQSFSGHRGSGASLLRAAPRAPHYEHFHRGASHLAHSGDRSFRARQHAASGDYGHGHDASAFSSQGPGSGDRSGRASCGDGRGCPDPADRSG